MIIIHAFMQVKEAEIERFLEASKPLIEGSRSEAGNISYALYQAPEARNQFIMVEEWKDAEAISFHNQTPHFTQFLGVAKELMAAPLDVKRFLVAE